MGDSCQFVKELRDDLQILINLETLLERDSSLFYHCENYSVEHWRNSIKKGVLKNNAIFLEKHLRWNPF